MKCFSLLIIFIISTSYVTPLKWVTLFNGKDLSGWDTYLGPAHDSLGHQISSIPIGLNTDSNKIFSVVENDGEKVIRVSGREIGGISTQKEYSNYHLQLMFKWGSWLQTGRRKKDSGLLYHCVGEHGADAGAWMRSQEFQIEEGNCGDYWGCAGGIAQMPAIKKSDSQYIYSPGQAMFTFSAESPAGRHCIKNGDGENATGEWNTLDLYCNGDTSMHVVNGKLVMILYHNAQQTPSGATPLTKGKIQLQSEGAEVFYKNIKLQSIDQLPVFGK